MKYYRQLLPTILFLTVGCGASSEAPTGFVQQAAGASGGAGAGGTTGSTATTGTGGSTSTGTTGTGGSSCGCPAGQQGPQGDMGPAGDQGAPGAKGDPGATGTQGPAGVPGMPGAQGIQGIPGAKGSDGVPITKTSLYVVDSGPANITGVNRATMGAKCNDANDIVISGSCASVAPPTGPGALNPFLIGFGPSTDPTDGIGDWLCTYQATWNTAAVGTISAKVTCLIVP